MSSRELSLLFVWLLFQPADPCAAEKAQARRYAADRYRRKKAQILAANRRWALNNPGSAAEVKQRWVRENPEKVRAASLNYRRKAGFLEGQRQYRRKRIAQNPSARIMEGIRGRIGRGLKTNTKGAKTIELLGMQIPEYRIYLQGQFRPGMTWDNWGDVWHIDHIKPCASFDLSNIEQQKACFNWSNTQPLFKKENWRKGANL